MTPSELFFYILAVGGGLTAVAGLMLTCMALYVRALRKHEQRKDPFRQRTVRDVDL